MNKHAEYTAKQIYDLAMVMAMQVQKEQAKRDVVAVMKVRRQFKNEVERLLEEYTDAVLSGIDNPS